MPTIYQADLIPIIELAERFAARELEPVCLDSDRYPFTPFMRSIYDNALETGLAGAALPERFGGTGIGYTAFGQILRLLARTDASPAFLIMVQSLAREIFIQRFPEADAMEIAAIGKGASLEILAFPALHDPEEPERGGVKAAETAEGYRLTGTASNLVGLPAASGVFIQADFSGKSLWAFIDLKTRSRDKNVLVKEPAVTLGLRACPIGDLELTGVHVPPNRVFIEPDGSAALADIVGRYRVMAANLSLGVLEGAYNTAKSYAEQRRQAKKRIIEHHMVRRMLAKMIANMDLGRAALERCAALLDTETGTGKSELISVQDRIAAFAAEGTTDAVQVLGGYGYMHDYGQEKRMRDAKQLQAVFGGSGARMMKIADKSL